MMLKDIDKKGLEVPIKMPTDLKIFLKVLLNPNPVERGLLTINKLKKMTFLKDYDWISLLERKLKQVPYLPEEIVPEAESISF